MFMISRTDLKLNSESFCLAFRRCTDTLCALNRHNRMINIKVNRESYMSAQVLLNLLNELGIFFISFSQPTRQEHEFL